MITSLKGLALECGLHYIGKDVSIQTIAINSNNMKNDALFVAIVANRDGHEFIPQAISNGAKALLVSKEILNIDIPQIVCNNTIIGLRKLAKEYRKSLTMPVISLTGSHGKTSVKEMIVTLLGDKKIHHTKGNLNNYLGVPMTILETPQDSEYVVVEAGTSVKGEIKAAAEIILPDIALITNVGASHLENLKTLDGVMQEKGELLNALSSKGYCIINLDDERIPKYAENINCNKITVSMTNSNSSADIFIVKYDTDDDKYRVKISIFAKEYEYIFPTIGKHNLFNSIIAIATLISIGLQPQDFLKNTAKITSYKGRFSIEKLNDNIILIDDTYNAGVSAVKAAIDDLADFEGRKILAISSMLELGDDATKYHQQMGQWIKEANIDKTFLFGNKDLLQLTLNKAQGENIKYYTEKEQLGQELIKAINSISIEETNIKTKIIVKGARGYKMEEIVNFIKTYFL